MKKLRTCVSVGGQIAIGQRANVYIPKDGALMEVLTSKVLHTIQQPNGDIQFETMNTVYECKVV